MNEKFERLARDLATAWQTGGHVPLPGADGAPTSRAEAYEIQNRMAELIGGRVAGWKVGATVRAVQIFEGHDGPLPGRIFADRLYQSPAQVPARLYPGVKLECEFAFRLTRGLDDPRGAFTANGVANSVTFHPAVELAGSRYAPGTGNRAARSFDGIADNGSGGGAVIGPAIEAWRDLAFETMPIDARIDDSPSIQAYSGAYRRDPLTILAETLNDLRARGVSLAIGDVVLTGSLTLPTPIRAGQTLVVRFADIATLRVTLV